MNLGFTAVLEKENPTRRRIQKGGTDSNKNGFGVFYGKVGLLVTHKN